MSLLAPLVENLSTIPPQFATLIIAMLPIAELRGSLPIALTVYKLPIFESVVWSVIGNMIPVYFLLVFFEKGSQYLRLTSPFFDRALDKLYYRTRIKLHDKVEKYGVWALIIFVGIPLPATGAWTGALAAFVFGLNRAKAFFSILLGVILAAAIVTVITLGISVTLFTIFG